MGTKPEERNISFSALEMRQQEIEPRTSTDSSVHQTAQRDLERYYRLMQLELSELTEAEWNLLRESCNGWMVGGPDDARMLWAQVDDTIRLNGMDKKWGVDGKALIEKLRALRPAQQLAIVDAVERWWAKQ